MNTLKEILNIPDFIVEEKVCVDGKYVYVRPLYIEYIYLHPDILNKLADEVSKEISLLSPQIIFTIEASVLPLASLIAAKLGLPLAIIRKTGNYKHEEKEPVIFYDNYIKVKNMTSVLLDDALYTGATINNIFCLFDEMKIKLPQCYFLFDLYNYLEGGTKIDAKYLKVINSRISWINYENILKTCFQEGLISYKTYKDSMELFHL
jgi:adenine/guanine phosphoribosyltransferase-like PRPP-binding protein